MLSSICYLTAGAITHAIVIVAQAPLAATAAAVVLATLPMAAEVLVAAAAEVLVARRQPRWGRRPWWKWF